MIPRRVHADLRSRAYCEWIDFLNKSENWTAVQIRQYQLGQIRQIVDHAARNTIGYDDAFRRAGVDAGAIQTLEDFRQFPLIDKETLRDRLAEFTAFTARTRYVTTGGSTGIPFGFYRENTAFARELASKAHQYHRVGWREGDRQIVFRGVPIKSGNHMQFYPRFNELRCSSYHLTPENMERYRQAAWKYRPDWLRCYPSSGVIFANWLRETGREFPPLKGILCASENLYDFQKTILRETFACRVFSHYGHYELAVLAGFCEHEDTYHVLPQYGFAELLDPKGRPVTQPGQMGEIVATSFLMRATPFIRYRTRDYAVFKSQGCAACGRPYAVWERIEGRLQEFIVTGSGRRISMTAVNMHDDIFDHLKQFQFHQSERGVVTFCYVPKPGCGSRTVLDILQRLSVKFGPDVALRARRVAAIPPTARGKHRFLIQKLPVHGHDA